MLEPTTEAIQDWLESKENEDRDAITEPRHTLLATLVSRPNRSQPWFGSLDCSNRHLLAPDRLIELSQQRLSGASN